MGKLEKYIYSYIPEWDVARNKIVVNEVYTEEGKSYEKTFQRCGSEERVSHFKSEDIIGKRVIDFGCAEGSVILQCRLQGAKSVIGIDYNPHAIAAAQERVKKEKITGAKFFQGDMENKAFMSSLPQSDTVLLLAILGTSIFGSRESVIAAVSRFAKHALYYEGHYSPESRVRPLFELLTFTDFTRFEYFGRHEWRILIRCGREVLEQDEVPKGAITSDDSDEKLLKAEEIYVFTDAPKNPPFSRQCRLIQFVKRST